jgi:hypothetical protein
MARLSPIQPAEATCPRRRDAGRRAHNPGSMPTMAQVMADSPALVKGCSPWPAR